MKNHVEPPQRLIFTFSALICMNLVFDVHTVAFFMFFSLSLSVKFFVHFILLCKCRFLSTPCHRHHIHDNSCTYLCKQKKHVTYCWVVLCVFFSCLHKIISFYLLPTQEKNNQNRQLIEICVVLTTRFILTQIHPTITH